MINEIIIDTDSGLITELNEEAEQPTDFKKITEPIPLIDSIQAETATGSRFIAFGRLFSV